MPLSLVSIVGWSVQRLFGIVERVQRQSQHQLVQHGRAQRLEFCFHWVFKDEGDVASQWRRKNASPVPVRQYTGRLPEGKTGTSPLPRSHTAPVVESTELITNSLSTFAYHIKGLFLTLKQWPCSLCSSLLIQLFTLLLKSFHEVQNVLVSRQQFRRQFIEGRGTCFSSTRTPICSLQRRHGTPVGFGFRMDRELKYRVSKLLLLPELVVGKVVVEATDEDLPVMSSSRLFTRLLPRELGKSLPMCPSPPLSNTRTFRYTTIAATSLAAMLQNLPPVLPFAGLDHSSRN